MLLGDGRGNFTVDRKNTNWNGDNKAVVQLAAANGSSLFLVSSNSDSLRAFRLQQEAVRTITVQPDDAFAVITGSDGRQQRQEFYYGNSYLSQSTRRLTVAPNTKSVDIYNSSGKTRTVNFFKTP
jgi:hypothetical protein